MAVLLTVSALAANAQLAPTDTIIVDNPDKARTTTLDLQTCNLSWYQGIHANLGVRAHAMLTDKIEPFIEYKKSYGNDPPISDADYPEAVVCAGGLKGNVFIEAGCNYYFLMKKVRSNAMVRLEGLVSVPCILKRLAGVRGGFAYYRKDMDFYDPVHPYYHYKSKDGGIVTPIDDWFHPNINPHPQPAGRSQSPYSTIKVPVLFAGISYKRIKHLMVEAEEEGRHVKMTSFDFYADVLFAPSIQIMNVFDTNKKEWLIVPGPQSLVNWGYRVGVSRHSGKVVGVTYTIEAGVKPAAITGTGFFHTGGFINLCWGICISSAKNLLGHPPESPNPAPVKQPVKYDYSRQKENPRI